MANSKNTWPLLTVLQILYKTRKKWHLLAPWFLYNCEQRSPGRERRIAFEILKGYKELTKKKNGQQEKEWEKWEYEIKLWYSERHKVHSENKEFTFPFLFVILSWRSKNTTLKLAQEKIKTFVTVISEEIKILKIYLIL